MFDNRMLVVGDLVYLSEDSYYSDQHSPLNPCGVLGKVTKDYFKEGYLVVEWENGQSNAYEHCENHLILNELCANHGVFRSQNIELYKGVYT